MLRLDVCSADDHDTQARLQQVLGELGFVADDTWHDSPLGIGLQTFRLGSAALTVFKDAWLVDLAGPEELVNRVVAGMREG